MRTRAAVLSVLASLGVLIAGWEIGASVTQSQAGTTDASSGSDSTDTSGTSGTSGSSGSGSATASGGSGSVTGAKDGSFTGATTQTQFGPVQVEVTIAGGKITDVKALQLTNYGGRSQQISNYAAPILRSEVIKAQSANVASVSGATFTTQGYLTSLQSALAKAKA